MARKTSSKSRRPTTSKTAPTAPAPAFPRFGQLPHEIRNMIWELALLHPQTIMISTSYVKQSMSLRGFPARPPPLLCTCQESRSLALALAVHTGPPVLANILNGGAPSFSLDRDMLLFTDPISLTTFVGRLNWAARGADKAAEVRLLRGRVRRIAVVGLLRPVWKIKHALANLPELVTFVCEAEDGLTAADLPGVKVEALSPRAFKRRFYG